MTIHADLSSLLRHGATCAGEQAAVAGGAARVERPQVRLSQVELDSTAMGVVLRFHPGPDPQDPLAGLQDAPRSAFLELAIGGGLLPSDWTGSGRLELDLSVLDRDETMRLTLVGARSRLITVADCRLAERTTLAIDLTDLPLIQGIRPPRSPETIRLGPDRSDRPCQVVLHDLRLVPLTGAHPPVLDGYGQRRSADWPGKVSSDGDLAAALAEEHRELVGRVAPAERSPWGGWTAGPRFAGSGFFRVERDADGRWWLVDPDGWPFWSYGPTGVRLRDETRITGREGLFCDVPLRSAAGWLDDDRFSFYRRNCLTKYGSPAAWRDHCLERFHRLGVNSLGNWSDPVMMDSGGIATTREFSSRIAGTEITPRWCDVFDPTWREGIASRCRELAAPYARDPWTIGWFVDNELPWSHADLLQAPAGRAIRRVFCELAQRRFADVDAFNHATGCTCSDWDAVARLDETGLGRSPAAADLRCDLMAAFATAYFSTIGSSLKAATPNHLYLGCRFVRGMPDPGIPVIAGHHCDVVTVNAYSIRPFRDQFDAWAAACGRPILIGEHQFALFGDQRQPPPPWTAATADERGRLETDFVRSAASLPYCVGCHWFQFVDQVGTGRSSNGENMLIGWMDITDRPHADLIAAAATIGAGMYQWHAEAR